MKKLNLSGFDLGVIIAAVVIALLGGGAWWYLSGALQDAQAAVATAKSSFDTYSASKSSKGSLVVSPGNGKTLQANIDVLKAQLDPLIHDKLLPKENTLHSIDKEDPVEWKHDLDDEVNRLKASAKVHGVTIPPNFYFGFSRYTNQSPNDEQTLVLKKQLVAVEQLTNILINAPVKSIKAVRRSYEEDPHTSASSSSGGSADTDHLGGYALTAAGNVYTAYPFALDFETTSENLRTVINTLNKSPYIFVVRTLTIQNSNPSSPQVSELDKLAGGPAPLPTDTPGESAATTSTKGPQFLFGNSTLKVKARIDMIEWHPALSDATPAPAPAHGGPRNPLSPGGH